jgi:hypothetical protein
MWLIGTLMNCIDGSMAQEQHRDVTDTLERTRHHPRSTRIGASGDPPNVR